MMFKYKTKVEQIDDFATVNGVLFGVLKGDEKLIRLDLNKSVTDLITNDFKISYFLPHSNTIIGLNDNGEAIQFNEHLKKMKFLEVQLDWKKYQSSDIVGYMGDVLDRIYGVYSLDNLEFKWTRKDIKALDQIEEYFIGQWQFVLTKYNRESGEIEWVRDFGVSYPELKGANGTIGYIGIQEKFFVIGIKQIDRILAIDIETGETLWERNTITSGRILDKEKRVIHGFSINYQQLSLETGEKLKSFSNRDYFTEIGIETQRSNYVLLGDHIITTDTWKAKIGAFNTKTGIFDWVYELEENLFFPGGKKIVYSAPYLFVYDSSDALHIFEKEDCDV